MNQQLYVRNEDGTFVPAAGVQSETYWLIESTTGPIWWDGRFLSRGIDPRHFTDDPNKAVRFARKADAERIVSQSSGLIATEHVWIGAAGVQGDAATNIVEAITAGQKRRAAEPKPLQGNMAAAVQPDSGCDAALRLAQVALKTSEPVMRHYPEPVTRHAEALAAVNAALAAHAAPSSDAQTAKAGDAETAGNRQKYDVSPLGKGSYRDAQPALSSTQIAIVCEALRQFSNTTRDKERCEIAEYLQSHFSAVHQQAEVAPAHPANGAQAGLSDAARDVLAERRRQIEKEGFGPAGDDEYAFGELRSAALCYISGDTKSGWPWDKEWWKPTDDRSDLIKAGALVIAEIERLDRAAPQKKEG